MKTVKVQAKTKKYKNNSINIKFGEKNNGNYPLHNSLKEKLRINVTKEVRDLPMKIKNKTLAKQVEQYMERLPKSMDYSEYW